MVDCDLGGRGILVTRAAHQSAPLRRLIEDRGGRALALPALEIEATGEPQAAIAQLRRQWDLMIFISPNAVAFAPAVLGDARIRAKSIAAVGQATATALGQAGYPVDLIPPGRYDSEGLLAMPELQRIEGRQVLIVRGEGGRPLLGDSLRARGAKVGYAEVYRRVRPKLDIGPWLTRWTAEVDLVTATSADVLDNLVGMLGEAGWPLLRRTPLLVISERMRAAAEQRGFETILQAAGADDLSLLEAICAWSAQGWPRPGGPAA
jgi:uroporphyrinogen-III synthase